MVRDSCVSVIMDPGSLVPHSEVPPDNTCKNALINLIFSLKLIDFKIRDTHPAWLRLPKGTKQL